MTAKNIQAGFKICGVFPFNNHPFDLPKEKHKSFKPEEVVKKSKLRYIPLYSPVLRHSKDVSKENDYTYDKLSDENLCELGTSQTNRRQSFSKSSCDTSFHTPESKRPLTPDSNKCKMPIKRII